MITKQLSITASLASNWHADAKQYTTGLYNPLNLL